MEEAYDENARECPVCRRALVETFCACPVCGWVMDPIQNADPEAADGQNYYSMYQAREIYERRRQESETKAEGDTGPRERMRESSRKRVH